MLYYRNEKKWKMCTTNVAKGVVLIGIAVWLSFSLANDISQANSPSVFSRSTASSSQGTNNPYPSNDSTSPVSSTAATLARGSFTEPAVGVLTSGFGMRWERNHTGIDIGGNQGTNIVASDGGSVLFSGWVDGYGNYIIIDHENGFQTAYGHCNELLVKPGDRVAQGQLIAYMGSTGNSTGPHLHFEVKLDGIYQDPLNYVTY